MGTQPVSLIYLVSLSFEKLLEQFLGQSEAGANRNGENPPELVLTPTADDMPFILLKRVGIWMKYQPYLRGNEDVFSGVIRTTVNGVPVQVSIEADATKVTIKRFTQGRA